MKKALSIAVSAAMLFSLSACGSSETIAETPSPTATELQASVETAAVDSSMFTKRDSRTDYDEAAAQYIDLDAQTGDLTLTEAGDYVLSGTLTDGSVIINAPEDAKLHLILNGAHIASQSAAALYVISADKVFITLADGSGNGVSAAGDSAEDDYANVDAAIFARCDISFNGSGSLRLTDASGNVLLSYTPADDYSCIVVSCPELSEGSEYTLSYGSASQSFTQSEAHMGSASNVPAGGFGGMGGNMGGGFDKSRRP